MFLYLIITIVLYRILCKLELVTQLQFPKISSQGEKKKKRSYIRRRRQIANSNIDVLLACYYKPKINNITSED